MRRETRKQPWQTFPFWFLILSGMAMTVAWKLDLLRPKPAHAPKDVAANVEELDPDWASEKSESEPVAQLEEQTEPVLSNKPDRSFPAGAESGAEAELEPAGAVADMQTAMNDEQEPAHEHEHESVDNSEVAQSEPLIQRAPPSEHETTESETPVNPFAKTTEISGTRSREESSDPHPQTASLTTAGTAKPRPQSPFGPARIEMKGTRGQDSALTAAESADPSPDEAELEKTSEEIIQTAATDAGTQRNAPAVKLALKNANEPAVPKAALAPPAGLKAAAEIDLTEIDRLIASGEDVEANFQMSNLYWKRPEVRGQIEERLRKVSYNIYFAPKPHYMDGYVVKPNDVLQRIAKEYNVSWEYLAKLNRTDPKKIRPGQTLKVIRGPFSAVVDLSDSEITIHSHGHFVHAFPVGFGRDSSTPQGTFKVLDKQRDPTYYGPDGVVEHDDPQNPLGEYWIDLGDSYGLHGTIDDSSIEKADAPGCIRLRNRDIADVYDLLTIGSEVLIRK
jgi:lipoprotein-anchoring transpeptidase ErfK/SrfK